MISVGHALRAGRRWLAASLFDHVMPQMRKKPCDPIGHHRRAVGDFIEEFKRLTSGRVKSLQPRDHRYEICDPSCAELQLRAADTGVKSWHWRFYWRGKRAHLVLGVWPDTSLAEAHEKASAARALLRRGMDAIYRPCRIEGAFRCKALQDLSS